MSMSPSIKTKVGPLGAAAVFSLVFASVSACGGNEDDNAVGGPCVGNADCPGSTVCGPENRCVSTVNPGGTGGTGIGFGGNTGTGSSGSGATGNTGGGCAQGEAEFSQDPPTVMLLVDQSRSMDEDFGGSSRWDVLKDALIGTDGIVTRLAPQVPFGLTLYSVPTGMGGMQQGGMMGECPTLTQVPIALNNFNPINATYGPAMTLGATPTGEAFAAITPDLAAYNAPGAKVVLLCTDGEPNGCDGGGGGGGVNQQGRQRVLDAVDNAFGQGIQTFVISVGTDVGEDHLHDVANLGRGLPVNNPEDLFYVASNQSELEQAILDIFTNLNCIFQLNGNVDPSRAGEGTVVFGGMPLTYGTDWRLVGTDQVEVLGASCAAAAAAGGAVTVSATFPCDVFDPDIPQ